MASTPHPVARRIGAPLLLLLITLWALIPQSAAAAWINVGNLPGLGNGHIWQVAVSPRTSTLVVAATDDGIYRSTNSGVDWSRVAMSGVRVWAIGFDARNPNVVYAGTDGQGIDVSNSAGVSWTAITAGLPSPDVRSLAFGLDDVAAGTSEGVALSATGTTWQPFGLLGSSIDALTVVSNQPSLRLMAGTDTGDVNRGYLFENSGTTWSVVSGGGLPESSASKGPVTVSALASGPLTTTVSQRPLVVDTSEGSYRSLDGGQTWLLATGLPVVGTNPITLTCVTIDPLNPALIYAGADAGGASGGSNGITYGGALVSSNDTGLSYTNAIGKGLNSSSENVESIAVSATNPPVVYIALDPANGPSTIDRTTDSSAPSPPTLVSQKPGKAIPVTAATPPPTPAVATTPVPTAAPATGLSGTAHRIFNWPMPLVLELIVALALIYGFIRWRQRRYAVGPP